MKDQKKFSKEYMLNIFFQYLSALTPRQKEIETRRIFNISYREYFRIIFEDPLLNTK